MRYRNESKVSTDCTVIKMHTCGQSLMEIIKKENSYLHPVEQTTMSALCVHHAELKKLSFPLKSVQYTAKLHCTSLCRYRANEQTNERATATAATEKKNYDSNSFQQVKRKAIISFACNLIH